MAFETIGTVARWVQVHDGIKDRSPGDVVTYDELGGLLALSGDSDRQTIQGVMQRAGKELEVQQGRAVEVVRNVGYRIVATEEHLRLAAGHQKRSVRQLKRAQRKVQHAHLDEVSPEVRASFQVVGRALDHLVEGQRRLNLRQRNLEQAMASLTTETRNRQENLDSRVAYLEAKLSKEVRLEDHAAEA